MAARRRVGQSPYLTANPTHQSTSSVSLQEYARSALSLGENPSSTSQPATSSSTLSTPTAQPKKRKKKGKPAPKTADPSIRTAVANAGLPSNASPSSSSRSPRAVSSRPRQERPQALTTIDSSTGVLGSRAEQAESADVQQFRQRHGVWDGIVADEEPPPAFTAPRSPSPPRQEPPEPSSPPPAYVQPQQASSSASVLDEWPPAFLLPSWLDVEHLPILEESSQDQDLLRAWRRDELSGLPVEERARRHHMRQKRKLRLERRHERSAAAAAAQARLPHPDPQSSLSDFMQATNEFIAQNFPKSPRIKSEEDSDSSDSEPNEPPVPPRRSARRPNSLTRSSPRVSGVTMWDHLGTVQEEEPNIDILPTPPTVTVWGQEQSQQPRPSSPTRPKSPTSNISSDLEDRRQVARRHSALLVRPLSIKRKPPPVPAPRRWAKVVERTSSMSSPSGDENENTPLATNRPLSGSFSPRIQALREQFETHRRPPPVPPRRSRVDDRPISISSTLQTPPTASGSVLPDAIYEEPSSVYNTQSQPVIEAAPSEPSYRGQLERISLTDRPSPSFEPDSSSIFEQSEIERSASPQPQELTEDVGNRPDARSIQAAYASLVGSTEPRTSTDPAPAPQEAAPLPPPTTTTVASEPAALAPVAPAPPTAPEASSASSARPPSRQQSAQYTELDVLASRINDQRVRTGEAYDDIVLLSEVLGTHQPARSVQQQKDMEEEVWDQIPVLMVEESRRRVDPKTGKTRIKLSCGGVNVNKCLICMAQFKAKDMCAIYPVCTHCFHENCLRSWLRRAPKASCPNCRQPLPEVGSA